MALEVLALDEGGAEHRARYDRLFEDNPEALIQQSSYWARAIAEVGPDRPVLLLCHEGERDLGALPLYLYENRHGNVLTSVPQPGPLGGVLLRQGLTPAEAEAVYAALLDRAGELARGLGCISLTIITNPFRPDLELYRRHLGPELGLDNFTQYVPLDEVVVEGRIALRDYGRRSNLSRNLRRAAEAEFELADAASEADFDAWYRVHERRHRGLGATPLSRRLLQGLVRVLVPLGKARLLLAKKDGEVAAGCLYVYHRDVLDVYMLSVDPAHIDAAPSFLLTERSLLWAAALGVRIYNWQSSPGRSSGVYLFKRQWGSREAPYQFLTKVIDADRMAALDAAVVRAEYPGHYVAPWSALGRPAATGTFRKE